MSINNNALATFLLVARAKTYAGSGGMVTAAIPGSKQLEYVEGDWLYRDVYYVGKGLFTGLEAIYTAGKPAWSMSYFGDFTQMTEVEIDRILRVALIVKKDTARLWLHVDHNIEGYEYRCEGAGSIERMGGTEIVKKAGKQVYHFQYAGGIIGPDL